MKPIVTALAAVLLVIVAARSVLASDVAFKSRVQSITCVYDDNAKTSPSLQLVKDNLVIHVRFHTPDEPTRLITGGENNGWYVRDLAKAFPEFKAAWNAAHPKDAL